MTYTVIVSAAAYEDLVESASWYESQSKGLGKRFIDNFYKCLPSLESNPYLISVRYIDVRIKYISRFPYGVHFLIEGNIVKIFAVFSTRRDPIKWNNRLKGEEEK